MENRKYINFTDLVETKLGSGIYIDRREETEYTIDEDDDIEDTGCLPKKQTVVIFVKELLKINPNIMK